MPTSKAEIMHFMMKNKEHSKLIREALSSPLGSTSREKANKMFSIMGKLTQSNDGAGGPGMMEQQQAMIHSYPEMTQPARLPESTKSMVIFHKIPSPKIMYGKKFVHPDPVEPPVQQPQQPQQQASGFDGAGGPGVLDGAGGIGSFFSNAYDQFKDAIVDYTTPDPVKPAAPSLPAYNPSTPVNITKIQNPLVTTPSAFGPVSTPTKAPVTPATHGTLTNAFNWMKDTALPTVGIGTASTFAGVESAAEWLVRNGYNTAKNIGNNLFNDSSTPILNNSNYVPMGDTLGAKAISALRDQAAAVRPASTVDPTAPYKPSSSVSAPVINPTKVFSTLNGINYNAAGDVIQGSNSVKSDNASPLGSSPSNSNTFGSNQIKTIDNTNLTSYSSDTNYVKDLKNVVDKLGGTNSLTDAASIAAKLTAFGKYGDKTNEIAAAIASATKKYGIDPTLLTAQVMKETGYTMSNVANLNNNFGGVTWSTTNGLTKGSERPSKEGGNYAKFGTIADGIDAQARVVAGLPALNKDSIASTKASPDSIGSSNISGTTGNGTNNNTSGSGTNTQLEGLPGRIQDGIKNNLGAGMFALREMENKNNPISNGKSLAQNIADQDAVIRKETGYDQLKTDKMIAEQEKVNLPQDMATFIRDRETYVATTDKNIADFRAKMETMDMSNPDTRDSANKYLNYLYTLRGRQNQTYMGYIQQAGDLQQRKVDNLTRQLSTATDEYKTKLNNYTSIKTSEYTTYMAALTDMYTTAKNAPTEALQLDYLRKQVTGAAALTPADLLKQGYTNQSKDLAGIINDKNGLARPGVDLMERVQMLNQLDPAYTSANIFQTYVDGVNNYLNSATDAKGGVADRGVTDAGKKRIADEAIRNFAHVAISASQSGDNQALILATNHAYSVGQYMAKSMGDTIEGSGAVEGLKKSIEGLAPKTFVFGTPKTPPSEAEFLKMVAKDTGGAIDESIAKAIYATFDRYRKDDGNQISSAAEAVHTMLYDTRSTDSKADDALLSNSDFANTLGNFYASLVLQAEFAQDPKVQAQMHAKLMGN